LTRTLVQRPPCALAQTPTCELTQTPTCELAQTPTVTSDNPAPIEKAGDNRTGKLLTFG
ncbi:MAG: hypothetical protein RJA72_1021, partial [Pseudomonadota bacterium]